MMERHLEVKQEEQDEGEIGAEKELENRQGRKS